ncbi:flagellar hook assembly protein FlgD [Aliidiomarina halalkaliphila]|uniref:Basal-body rod modification protein FlgD n=1 Tax=Aliidiomarina halalkaliphila TaxID=2593535 RepID=A0A552X201_9GAMM|nr:flagellar hook assembly protein FlgD [Aliidiomarina halalkaliphila]
MNQLDPSVINAINGGGPAGQRNSAEMRENFMTLLVAQLRNQDPLNPMDNAEMTSQLAQINTVSGIEQLNETMNGINDQIDASKFMQATALIGKAVLVPGERVLVGEGETTPIGIELGRNAEKVKVSIVDGSGQVVRELDLGRMNSGMHSIAWDGKLADGTQAPNGAYRFRVEAEAEGKPVSSKSFNYAQVLAVSQGHPDGPRLDLGGIYEPVRLEDVRQVI